MNILAIETSCDETAVAIVRDGRQVLANSIASQIALHQPLGGVKPELAARQHILAFVPTLEEALQRAGLDWDSIDAIAVTCGPGLAGALLVGLNAAKALAFARAKPLIAVNHLEAHIYSNWIDPATLDAAPPTAAEPPPPRPEGRAGLALRALGIEPPIPTVAELPAQRLTGGRPQYTPPPPPPQTGPDLATVVPGDPAFPLLCLVVSGGHTELILMSGHGQYSLLGKTVDDAAGEAFDKVARILGLPYPGGPAIQQAAESGDPRAIELPRSTMRGSYDFSFSGLKTAALRQAQAYAPPLTPAEAAAEREAAERTAAEARARQEAEIRAAAEAAEAARRAQREAEAAARRAAEDAAAEARRQADEQDRQEAAEARRTATARRAEEARIREEEDRIRRAEQERLSLAEERARLEAERERLEATRARQTPAAREPLPDNPAARPAPDRSRRAGDRPPISILGSTGRTPAPASPSPPAPPPRRWGPPDRTADEEQPESTEPTQSAPKRRNTSGLIRIPPSETGPAPDEAPRSRFNSTPSAPTEQLSPRVLGKGDHEAVPPPAFLAERGGGTPPTPMPRNRTTPPDPDVPAFLRERSSGAAPQAPPTPPAKAEGGKPADSPIPRRPNAEAAPPRRPAQRSLIEDLVDEDAAPTTPPARPSTASVTPEARPNAARPELRTQNSELRTPPTPPRPKPPIREARPVPKPGGRADDDEADAAEVAAGDEAPKSRAGRSREELIRDLFADDEDLGSDDEPPPRPPRPRSLGLDSTRPPDARVPVPSADDPPADPAEGRRAHPKPNKPRLPVADFAASFQDAAVEMLVEKTVSAAAAYKVRTVLVAGGVAANLRLRERLRARLGPDIQLRYPSPILCTDNAAMVAAAAYFRYEAGLQHDWTLDIDPNARYVE